MMLQRIVLFVRKNRGLSVSFVFPFSTKNNEKSKPAEIKLIPLVDQFRTTFDKHRFRVEEMNVPWGGGKEYIAWAIQNSDNLPSQVAGHWIASDNNFKPIFSQNRTSNSIVFTVIPFSRPPFFELLTFSDSKPPLSFEKLTEILKNTPNYGVGDKPIYRPDGKIAFENEKEGLKKISAMCTMAASYLMDWIYNLPDADQHVGYR